MGFEVFQKPKYLREGGRASGFTINEKGRASPNRNAKTLVVGDNKYVTIYHDKDTKEVCLKFTKDEHPSSLIIARYSINIGFGSIALLRLLNSKAGFYYLIETNIDDIGVAYLVKQEGVTL